jgi:hypothetical protein
MRHLFFTLPCALVMAIAAPVLAQEPSGRITVEADGVAAEWTIVASPPANTPNENGEPMQSVFAPQTGDFEGVDMLVMWATPPAGGAELMMLAVYHRVTGEPSFVDQYFKGFLFHYPNGEGGAWVSDFGAPGSEIVLDGYTVSGDLATATGHFTTTAYFEPDDADEPDESRALAISGTFAAQLPRLDDR